MDSFASPKVKIMEKKGIRALALACSTSGVEGHARAKRSDKWVNYSHKYAQTKQQVS
jgi:hypothetical protein